MRLRRSPLFGLAQVLVLSLALGAPALAAPAAKPLPALGANLGKVSVSGLSSGGYMAMQYDVAFSASSLGAGVVAGGPYACAAVNGPLASAGACLGGAPSAKASWAAAQGFAREGRIDSLDHLARHRVYLFVGTKDPVIKRPVMDAARDVYREAGVAPAALTYVTELPAGHGFIAPGFGAACEATAGPYVNQCSLGGRPYDQPGAILAWLHGPLKPKPARLSAQPVAFDQGRYASPAAGMARTGYAYIPAACARGGCAVHVVFHGCHQGADSVGDAVYARVGYNGWADANRIVMLYPQVDIRLNPLSPPLNIDGCWDWTGFTGADFATRKGPQMAAVKAMVDQLGKRP